MDILVCPKCKNDLILNVRKEDKEEIIEGELKCNNCSEIYPINDGIPNLLTSDLQG
ncbi:MAG: hypothetical protein CL766_07535 [Chloroflexi bacterium]|nr:hypothetical protein [Chloroflexota bacterium]